MKKVLLSDIIEGMQFASEYMEYYYCIKTEEIVSISDDDKCYEDDDTPMEEIPEWQREEVITAREIYKGSPDYIPLPDKYFIHDYEIMERFSLSLTDEKLRNKMCFSLRGSGAFRRFKDNIYRFGIEKDWFAYRDEVYREIAVQWCKDNNILFEDE